MVSNPVRFLVCGAGNISREYSLRHLTQQNGVCVVGIVDPREEARKSLTDLVIRSGVTSCAHFASFAEAANSTDFAAVYIGTPPGSHARLVREALSLRKHVLLEKPLAASPRDADEIVALSEVAEKEGVQLMVNIGMQYNKAATMLRQNLREDLQTATGQRSKKIVSAAIRLYFSEWPREWQKSAVWVGHRDEGGPLREVGTHFIFGFQKIFGMNCIQRIRGLLRYPNAIPGSERACEISVTATCEVSSTRLFGEENFCCEIDVRTDVPGDDKYELHVILNDKTEYLLYDFTSLAKVTGDGTKQILCENEAYGRTESVQALIAAINREGSEKSSSGVTARDARNTQRVIDALIYSDGKDFVDVDYGDPIRKGI